MKERQVCNSKNYRLIFLLCLFGVIWSLWGCGEDKEVFSEIPETLFPSLDDVLRTDEGVSEHGNVSEDGFPSVRIYFDNTGSMEGFTINNEGRRGPCSAYVKLMRCLRDMGRVRETQYYVLDVDLQDWVLSETDIYDCFTQNNFHVWWASGQPGPLSKLCMDNRIDETCINIVLTDLAEQSFNTTELAEQIRKICDQKECEADLFAFEFDFNGVTQVPDPEEVSKMLEGDIHGKRPYYMIITGPSEYTEKYVEKLKQMLAGDDLNEGVEYFTVTNRLNIERHESGLSDVIFEPFANYDEIKQKTQEKNKNLEDEETIENEAEEACIGIEKIPRNLQRYENTDELFEDDEESGLEAFYYQKIRGVKPDYSDWRLNFYIPLDGWEEPQKNFSYQCSIYHIEEIETELSGQEQQTEPEIVQRRWVKSTNSQIDISKEVCRDYEVDESRYPAVLYVSIGNKNALEKIKPEWEELLLVVDVTQEDILEPQSPEWLGRFDTGNTDELFTHTYGLNDFYDVLFGYEDRVEKDGAVHIKNNYIQIPILLTNLKEQKI